MVAVLLPLSVRGDTLAWELVQLAGYFSAIGCLFLLGASLRPRDAQPSKLLSLEQHRWLAWGSITLLGMHVGGVLLVEPQTIEYLKPSMPAYQLAGILATLALCFVSVTALARVRRSLWQNTALFRALHIVVAACGVALIFVHVVATDRYASGPGRWLWAAITTAVLLLPLQRVPQTTQGSRWPLAFRHYPKRIFLALVLAALACLALAAQTRERRARLTLESVVSRAKPLRIEFPHEQHGSVNCAACHHNFVDRSGVDTCISCHRSARADLRLGAEARFHTFCMDCHRHGALSPTDPPRRGPTSQCSACHRAFVQVSNE